MSILAIVIIYFIFRATGILDKIFYKLGYIKDNPKGLSDFFTIRSDITEHSGETETTETATDSTAPMTESRYLLADADDVDITEISYVTETQTQPGELTTILYYLF